MMRTPGYAWGAMVLSLACGPQLDPLVQTTDGSDSGGTTADGADEESGRPPSWRGPFRDEWRVEADLDFIHTDAAGTPLISTLVVGGVDTDDNFANRGDVIVNFDGPQGRILVELRRFTYNTNQEDADEDFGDLSLLAYAAPLELNATGNDFPWEVFGNASYPGEPAIAGAGYSIVATSSACGPVRYTEHPEEFVGPGNEAMQATSERGNLEVCTGCITQTCNELVP